MSKFISLRYGNVAALDSLDFAFGIKTRYVLLSAGVVECAVAYILLNRLIRDEVKYVALLWFSAGCVSYRVLNATLPWISLVHCNCLGVEYVFGFDTHQILHQLSKVVLLYFMSGSFLSLFVFNPRKSLTVNEAVVVAEV